MCSCPITPKPLQKVPKEQEDVFGMCAGVAMSSHALLSWVFLLDLPHNPQTDEVHRLVCDKVASCQPWGQH